MPGETRLHEPAAPAAITSVNRHIWQFQWVRDLGGLLAIIVIGWAAYSIRPVVTPIIAALALAYVFNPLVTWAQKKRFGPRWATTVLILLLGVGIVTALIGYLAPKLVAQIGQLIERIPSYLDHISQWLGVDWHALLERANLAARGQLTSTGSEAAIGIGDSRLANMDWKAIGQIALASLGFGLGVVGSVFSVGAYLVLASVTGSVCFFFFSWKFDRILAWFGQFIPPADRERTLRIINRMDHSIAAFIRGRLVQASVMGLILSVGWWIAGVPFWLLLGLLTGMLNLVPYAAVLGAVAATALAVFDHLSTGGQFSISILLWPVVVYGIAQVLDGWVVEPAVQGKATDLDPLTVLLAVLISGALAGVLGMIVAIPLTACLKILAQEMILPRIRQIISTL